jgi:hypothetical protein
MGTFARKYGSLIYWALFMAITFYQAQFPGYIPLTERLNYPYPWSAAFEVAVLITVLVGAFHLILGPMSYRRSWGRLAGAWGCSLALCAFSLPFAVTDMPGYYYVPIQFALLTFVTMSGIVTIQLIAATWRRVRHAT